MITEKTLSSPEEWELYVFDEALQSGHFNCVNTSDRTMLEGLTFRDALQIAYKNPRVALYAVTNNESNAVMIPNTKWNFYAKRFLDTLT